MRGLEKGLVILDKTNYSPSAKPLRKPAIVKVLKWGNGWIDVLMNDGNAYRRSGGTLSWRYNNPGNVKFGRFAKGSGAIGRGWGSHGGHAVFPTYEAGKRAKAKLLFTPIRKYYNLPLYKALSYYAPRSDGNRPKIYTRFVVQRTPGVTSKTLLKHFTKEQQEAMLKAMERFEGFRPGRITRI